MFVLFEVFCKSKARYTLPVFTARIHWFTGVKNIELEHRP